MLSMRNIEKEYFGNKVLKNVNLDIKKGEIHALLGENGAGKSTLMNILFGMPVIHNTGGFKGEVLYEGKASHIKNPKDAMNAGIGMVHQEFMLIPGFTITENIKLNREITKHNIVSRFLGHSLKSLNYDVMNKESRRALNTAGLSVEEYVEVEGLPVGYMQFIEIAREIDKKNIRLLVFDEPTAVLTESEAEKLMEAMKRLADQGIAIIFITHRLDEVINSAHRITILRDGEVVAHRNTEETNIVELAELMVGRKIERLVSDTSKEDKDKETILQVRNLNVDMPGEKVKGIDLDIYKGEIVGIGGLAGQGKIGIANGIMGLFRSSGKVTMEGSEIPLNKPEASLKHGIAFVSEDRRGVGLLLDDSIENNIVITSMHINDAFVNKYLLFTQLDKKKVREHCNKMIKDLDIRCTGPNQITRRLSGGNQQKVCIARALTLNPKILFVSEPTRGIDVGAKKLVLDLLVKLNKKLGMTIIMTSSELAELRSICERVVIVSEGKIAGILKPEASDAEYGLLLAGHIDIEVQEKEERISIKPNSSDTLMEPHIQKDEERGKSYSVSPLFTSKNPSQKEEEK